MFSRLVPASRTSRADRTVHHGRPGRPGRRHGRRRSAGGRACAACTSSPPVEPGAVERVECWVQLLEKVEGAGEVLVRFGEGVQGSAATPALIDDSKADASRPCASGERCGRRGRSRRRSAPERTRSGPRRRADVCGHRGAARPRRPPPPTGARSSGHRRCRPEDPSVQCEPEIVFKTATRAACHRGDDLGGRLAGQHGDHSQGAALSSGSALSRAVIRPVREASISSRWSTQGRASSVRAGCRRSGGTPARHEAPATADLEQAEVLGGLVVRQPSQGDRGDLGQTHQLGVQSRTKSSRKGSSVRMVRTTSTR